MGSALRRASRASALLCALLGLAACVPQPNPYGYAGPGPFAGGPGHVAVLPAPAGRRIELLLPLTGASADIGRSLRMAAELALADGPPFDVKDTNSTPEGAAEAAHKAIETGAGIIVGPLTAAETDAVAPIARARNIPVLAFTSDSSKAQPGVWPMGITPAQQVRTLVSALRADGKSRIGAVLPSNPFGDALATTLTDAAAEARMPPPVIVRYTGGGPALDSAVAQLASGGAPPVDAVLFGASAAATAQALPALARAGLSPDRVRVLGTALWARDAAHTPALAGAWYPGPDPETEENFNRLYRARYGSDPRGLAGIAYDAAGAARAVASPNGINVNALLNPAGFAGADGTFLLLADGGVRRALALFEVTPTGVRVRTPGARSFNSPGLM